MAEDFITKSTEELFGSQPQVGAYKSTSDLFSSEFEDENNPIVGSVGSVLSKIGKVDKKKSIGELAKDSIFNNAIINSFSSGLYKWSSHTLTALDRAAQFISEKTGLERGGIFDDLSKEYYNRSEKSGESGLPGIPGKVVSGLGQATGDIASIMTLGPYGLPIHGGLMGGAEGGPKGAALGAIKGATTHGVLGIIGRGLPSVARIPAYGAYGAATTPGGLEDKVAGAATMMVLGRTGEKKKVSEFIADIKKSTEPRKAEPQVERRTGERWSLEELTHARDRLQQSFEFIDEVVRESIERPSNAFAHLPKEERYNMTKYLLTIDTERRIDGINKEIDALLRKNSPEIAGLEPPSSGGIGIVAKGFEPPVEKTPAERKILDQIRRPMPFKKMKAAIGKMPDEVIYNLYDKLWYLKEYSTEVNRRAKKGKEIPYEKDPYWSASLLPGREGIIGNAMEDLRKVFVNFRSRGDKKNLMLYLMSMRNLERSTLGKENPGGVTREDAARALFELKKRLPPAEATRIALGARQFYAWADKHILQRLVDSNVISKKGYEYIKSRNKFWLPFEVDIGPKEMGETLDLTKYKDMESFFGITQDVILGMKGTKQKIKPPLDTIMARLSMAVSIAEKNKVLMQLVKTRNTSDWAKRQIKRIPSKAKVPEGKGTFGVIINGRVVKYSAPMDIIRSLQSISPSDMRLVEKVMGKANAIFRTGTTSLYLPFSVFNIPRDYQMATTTSKYGFNPVTWLEGLAHGAVSSFGMPTKLYRDFLESKAGFGGLIQRSAEGRVFSGTERYGAKELFKTRGRIIADNVLNPLELVQNIAKSFELAPRLAVFKKARGHEGSEMAAGHARRSTIDFSRSGETMKLANRWIPFLNARVQAKVSLAEAIFSHSGLREGKGTFVGIPMDARMGAILKGMSMVVLPGIATYAYNRLRHGETYDKVPDDYKEKYFVIVTGEEEDNNGDMVPKIITIPKGDVGTLIFNPIENFLDWGMANRPLETRRMLVKMISDLLPVEIEREGKISPERAFASVMPPQFKAAGEAITGKNLYWGKDIVPSRLQNIEPSEQYTDKTPEAYKKLGKITGQSPMILQHTARNIFGSIMTDPTPIGQLSQLKKRLSRTVWSQTTDDIYKITSRAATGYDTARLRATRELMAGNKEEAKKIVMGWNEKARELMAEIADLSGHEYGEVKKSSLYKRYTFQDADFKRLLKAMGEKDISYLEKQLGFKIK